MTTSKEVISYLKTNLNKQDYASVFYAGSVPEKLIPQSDFDIYIVIKNERKNPALDNLKKIMTTFTKQHNDVTFSFYKGPIKYKTKGLVHFLIYLEKKEHQKNVAFVEDHKSVLKNVSKDANMILGKEPKILLKGINLNAKEDLSSSLNKWEKKYSNLVKNNRIQNMGWKKKGKEWDLVMIYKKPSDFLRNYIIEYYDKHLTKLRLSVGKK